MGVYCYLGKYGSTESLKKISKKRTESVRKIIQKEGGALLDAYVLAGEKDVLLIAEVPSLESAIKISVEMAKTTGIAFETLPAISVEDFDQLVEKKRK